VVPVLQVSPIVMDPPTVSVMSEFTPAWQFVTGVPTEMLYTRADRVPVFANVHVFFPQQFVSVFKLLVLFWGAGGADGLADGDNDNEDVDVGGIETDVMAVVVTDMINVVVTDEMNVVADDTDDPPPPEGLHCSDWLLSTKQS